MSSPSRPASHALMILSTSSRFSSVSISFSCFFDFASRVVLALVVDFAASTTSSFVGSSTFFLPRFGLMSSSFRRWKGPSSAPARSRPTEGFSAITRVFGMQNTIAPLGMGAGAEILGRVKPSPFYSLAAVLSWPVLRWLYRLRDQGTENLPREGGYVLAANHTSNFDPWPLGLPIWPENFLRFMA